MHDDNYWKEVQRAVVSSRPIAIACCCAMFAMSGWNLYSDYVSRADDAWSVAWHVVVSLLAAGGLLALITVGDNSPDVQKTKD